MAMAITFSLYFISFFILLSFPYPSSSNITTISILPSFPSNWQKLEPWQRINQLAAASRSRAEQHKRRKNNKIPSSLQTNVYPIRPGYLVSLSLGTPPQEQPFIFDTASSLVWFPCTDHFQCNQCDFINFPRVSPFIPTLSTSAKFLACKNPTCSRLLGNQMSQKCTGSCSYSFGYGSGSTSGILLSETIHFSRKCFKNFMVGCSTQSLHASIGIAGFGLEPSSLPAQLGLKKFSYCLLSHKFDGKRKSSKLVMVAAGENDGSTGKNLRYTPFRNPPQQFGNFYYITITKITVGGVDVRVPLRFLRPGPSGMGGTIVDSGSTITSMDNEVYELVAKVFEKQMQQKHYHRDFELENIAGIEQCYNVSGKKSGNFPELAFHLVGGAKMEFPMSDNIEVAPEVFCLSLLNSPALEELHGPSIVLGSSHQQNLYMEFDLENKRLGFKRQICK